MSNRIEPTHFIEVWKGLRKVNQTLSPHLIESIIEVTDDRTVALFLIRPKTPQEKANSIYYPLNETL